MAGRRISSPYSDEVPKFLGIPFHLRRIPGLRDKMSCSRVGTPPVGPAARCGLPTPELQMISNRIARNIIRYVFHYLTEASGFKLDYR